MNASFARRLIKLTHNRTYISIFALCLMSLVAAVASTVAVARLPMLQAASTYVQDWQIANLLPPEPQDNEIVVVAINEETLQKFPYRSPVDREFLSNLILTLAARHPRAIGVDILFDQPTEPAKDALLKRTLASLRVPLVVAFPSETGFTPQQKEYLKSFVPLQSRALPNTGLDPLGTVRWNVAGMRFHDGRNLPSLAHALAAAAGVKLDATTLPMVWHGQPAPNIPAFRELPSQAVNLLPASWLTGKIILIGEIVSLEDRHRTPFSVGPNSEQMAGVLVQAHAVAQLLHHKTSPLVSDSVASLIALICAVLGGTLGMLELPLLPRIAGVLFVVLATWIGGLALFHYTNTMTDLISPSLALFACFSAMDSLTGREARRQRQFIQGAFSHYVSPKVVESLIQDPSRMALEGERREMTYLFTDIADFTTFSEEIDSKELARILNTYFEGATQIVLRHEGMLDKFIGDAVFAIFNAPVDLADHAEQAVRCALDIDQWAEAFRVELNSKGFDFGITRLGIHTGVAVIGNFGSKTRFNYTAQGDAVNTASRLEGANKQFGTRICVSGTTRSQCKTISFRPIGSVVLKGKTKPIDVWEPLRDGEKDEALLERYRAAFAKLERQSPEAIALFDALSKDAPDDPCVLFHAERLRRGAVGATITMTEK